MSLAIGCGTASAPLHSGPAGRVNAMARSASTGAPCDAHFLQACDARCSRGDARSCLFMGLVLQGAQAGVGRDEGRSLQYHLAACGGGEAAGCMFAGVLLVEGKAILKDIPRGYSLLQQACAACMAGR